MNIEQEKMIVEALPSLYPLQEFEEKAIHKVIDALPSAEPKVGKWERHYSRPNVYADLFWHCSECGYRSSDNWADKFNFCPHCGANMRGAICE